VLLQVVRGVKVVVESIKAMTPPTPKGWTTSDDDLITVCDACLQASCWQGIFYCQRSKTAGTVKKTRRELRGLAMEHPSYWKTDEELARE
jgi:hypothetical protein